MSSATTRIDWTHVKALSFDIYGTLIDWETGILRAARATQLGQYLPLDDRDLLLGIEKYDTVVQKEHPTWPQTDIIAEGLRRYVKEEGLVTDGRTREEEVKIACREYADAIGRYPAFPDTVAAMQRLGNRFKLIPLSNVDRASFSKTLDGPLFGVKFDAVYTAEEIGSYKPDIRNFEYLLDHVKEDFGLEKGELVHVAQSLFHDHGPAKEMGLRSVWVDRGGVMGGSTEGAEERYGFRLRVETLEKLADIVDEAFGEQS